MTPRSDFTHGETVDAAEFVRRMENPTKRDKFGRVPPAQRRWNGRTYGSKAEMQYAQQLALDPDALVIIDQPKLRLGVAENVYVPDFFVLRESSGPEYVDVKGHETAKFKRDKKLWRQHGRVPLRIVRDGRTVEIIWPERAE